MKIKVTHIINNLERGGAETVLSLLLKYLKNYPDIELTLISLEGHGPIEKDIIEMGIKYKKFNFHLFNPFLRRFEPYFRFRLWWYVLINRPDIIHGHLIVGEDFAKVLGMLLKIPVVTTLHDIMIKPGRKQQFLNKYIKIAVAVSPLVSQHLESVYGISEDRIRIIPDAIEMDKFKNANKVFNSDKPVFIYIGRLFKTKGIEYAMAGLAKLQKEFPGISFDIYGPKVNESDYTKWEKLIKKNGWSFIKFRGPISDVPAALKTGDIFILPSNTEGFAMAPLEAAAASKPLILTRTGAMVEMLKEGENGYFVEYGNSEQIYDAAKKIVTGDVESMGKNSYKIVKGKFNVQNVAKMYYNLYLSIKENKC